MIQVLQGHWVDVLKTLPDESVQTCVTSPPYFGLRRYLSDDSPLKHLELGQEKSPEEYVAKLVEGFREVRRVLRDNGVLWLNLGTSFFSNPGNGRGGGSTLGGGKPHLSGSQCVPVSGDNDPTQSPQPVHVPACGSDDRALRYSSVPDRACPYCGGVLQDGSQTRRDYIARNTQRNEQSLPLREQTNRDSEHSDCASSSPRVSAPFVPLSTTASSSLNAQDVSGLSTTASEHLKPTHSSPLSSQECGHTPACNGGKVLKAGILGGCTLDTGLFCKACGYCSTAHPTYKPKDLIMIPTMVAEALRADGWYLRSDIIWDKKNCMPESVTDRPTRSHEYIFLLSKVPNIIITTRRLRNLAFGTWTAPELPQERRERQKN